jgi:hypothetical protein
MFKIERAVALAFRCSAFRALVINVDPFLVTNTFRKLAYS